MDFTIRQATTKDFATIQSLNQLLFDEEYETNHDDALDLHWPQSEEAIEYYRKKLSSPDSIVFVAYDGGNYILGYVIGSSVNKFRYRTVVTGELENMYVVKEARRNGVGKALVNAIVSWMKMKGVNRVYVSAYGNNEHAIHFYDAMGFTLWEVGMEKKL